MTSTRSWHRKFNLPFTNRTNKIITSLWRRRSEVKSTLAVSLCAIKVTRNQMVLSPRRALAPAHLRLQMASVRQKEVRAISCNRSRRFQASTTLITVAVVIIDRTMTSAQSSRRSRALVVMHTQMAKARSQPPPPLHNNILTQTLILLLNQPINNLISLKASVKTLISLEETSLISPQRQQQCNNSNSSRLFKWLGVCKKIQPWIQWWTTCCNISRRPIKISKNRSAITLQPSQIPCACRPWPLSRNSSSTECFIIALSTVAWIWTQRNRPKIRHQLSTQWFCHSNKGQQWASIRRRVKTIRTTRWFTLKKETGLYMSLMRCTNLSILTTKVRWRQSRVFSTSWLSQTSRKADPAISSLWTNKNLKLQQKGSNRSKRNRRG